MSDPSENPPPAPAPGAPTADAGQDARPDAGEVEALRARVAALEAKGAELEAQAAAARGEKEARERELLDRLARLQADFENFRRRSRDEAAAAAGRGKEALLRALLPALDNLDRALAHAQDEGLRLLARQLQAALRDQGVQVLDPQGEAFDARLHEAIAQEAREGAKPGVVLAVAEKGYALEGRVVRPARVVVAA